MIEIPRRFTSRSLVPGILISTCAMLANPTSVHAQWQSGANSGWDLPAINRAGRFLGWGYSRASYHSVHDGRLNFAVQRNAAQAYPSQQLQFAYSPHYRPVRPAQPMPVQAPSYGYSITPAPANNIPVQPKPSGSAPVAPPKPAGPTPEWLKQYLDQGKTPPTNPRESSTTPSLDASNEDILQAPAESLLEPKSPSDLPIERREDRDLLTPDDLLDPDAEDDEDLLLLDARVTDRRPARSQQGAGIKPVSVLLSSPVYVPDRR